MHAGIGKNLLALSISCCDQSNYIACRTLRIPRSCSGWSFCRGFMKILYYDCFAGISGDMNLAALIDLGVSPEYLRAELAKLAINDEFQLHCQPEKCSGIQGMQVHVRLRAEGADHADFAVEPHGEHAHGHKDHHGKHHHHDHQQHGHHHEGHHHGDQHEGHHHEHGHHAHTDHAHAEHDHKEHAHQHAHGHDHGHGSGSLPRRNLGDIAAIIGQSTLAEPIKQTSLRIFRLIAEAEAKVHGKPIEDVHFHEVGATDSIVDIVGAAICFHALGVDAVWASPLELGSGFVRCAHGMMPVPAPATVEILHNIPTTRGGVEHEATTPTGAAIIAALATAIKTAPAMTTFKTGYGIGHRQSARPNMLRVHLAEVDAGTDAAARAETAGAEPADQFCQIQCTIDDMSGEMLAEAMDILIEQGAGDVYFTPVVMKKNRPGILVSVICAANERARITELLLRHTTTLGVKVFSVDKTVLEQRFAIAATPLGEVRVKQAFMDGKVLRSKPEFEDCKALARLHGIPLAEVYAAISKVTGQ